MNTRQKVVLAVGTIILVALLICPPWKIEVGEPESLYAYNFIWKAPGYPDNLLDYLFLPELLVRQKGFPEWKPSIDYARLAQEIAPVVIVALGLFFIFKGKPANPI